MTTAAQTEPVSLPAIERYFEVSLFLLVRLGLSPSSRRENSIPSRCWCRRPCWRGKGFGFSAARPGTFAARRDQPGAGLLLILPARFVVPLAKSRYRRAESDALCRLARGDPLADFRDARAIAFRALASRSAFPGHAGGHVHVGFGNSYCRYCVSDFAGVFLLISVSTFIGLEIRRSATGAITPPLEADSPGGESSASRRGADFTSRGGERAGHRHCNFLYDSAIHYGLSECAEFAPFADDRIQRQRDARSDRRN